MRKHSILFVIHFLLACLVSPVVAKSVYSSLDQLLEYSDVVVRGDITKVTVTPEKNSYEASKIIWDFKIQEVVATRRSFREKLPETIPVCTYAYLINGKSVNHQFEPSIFFLWKASDCYIFAGHSRGLVVIDQENARTGDIWGEPEAQSLAPFIQRIQKRSKIVWKRPRKTIDATANFD